MKSAGDRRDIPEPNQPAAGNARVALQFAVVSQWPGVPKPGR